MKTKVITKKNWNLPTVLKLYKIRSGTASYKAIQVNSFFSVLYIDDCRKKININLTMDFSFNNLMVSYRMTTTRIKLFQGTIECWNFIRSNFKWTVLHWKSLMTRSFFLTFSVGFLYYTHISDESLHNIYLEIKFRWTYTYIRINKSKMHSSYVL